MRLDPRIVAAWERFKREALNFGEKYKDLLGLVAFWLVLNLLYMGMLNALSIQKVLMFLALNVFGQAFGAGIAYLGLRWSIRSWNRKNWRRSKWLPMFGGTVVTIIGLVILVLCPFLFGFMESYNHAVFECMVDRGMTVRQACDQIVSEQYQRQPKWEPFYHYQP